MEKMKYAIVGVPTSLMFAMSTFAGEVAGTANSAVVEGLTTTAADMRATGLAIVPVALTVIGLSLVVRYGVRLFNKVAK